MEALLAPVEPVRYLRPISRFPAAVQYLALVVDEGVSGEQVRQAILVAGGELLADALLFDVYRGAPVPPGKKILAFSLTYQAHDRTLTDDEVNRLQGRIVRRLQQELGAELRG